MPIKVKYLITHINFLLITIFASYNYLYTQGISATAAIDTNNVLIGDHINLLLQFSSQTPQKVIFPFLADTIGNFEIVKKSQIDTIQTQSQFILKQNITITAFDSGTFVIPPLTFLFEKKGTNEYYPITTDSIKVHFNSVEVDTTKPFKDIKPPLDEPITFDEYLPYIITAVGILSILALAYLLWKKYKSREIIKELDYDPKIPPDVSALKSLQELENAKLWQAGKIKLYHSRLTEILRIYIHRVFNIKALEMTSSEIIGHLQTKLQDNHIITNLQEILERADLVKFAKFEPLPYENSASLSKSIEFVTETYKIATTPIDNNEGAKE